MNIRLIGWGVLWCSSLGLAAETSADDGATLLTATHELRITVLCPEGVVSCDRVRYVGTDKRSGKTLTLRGSTVHTLCADGVTPCTFVGYRFQHGALRYFVGESPDGEKGSLIIHRGKTLVLKEEGRWQR